MNRKQLREFPFVYNIGGTNGKTPLQSCELLNVITGESQILGSLNLARSHFEAIEFIEEETGAQKLIVLGGCGAGGDKIKSIETYDPASDTWELEQGFDVGINLSQYSSVNLDNRIYVIGGDNDIGTIKAVRYFTWKEKKWHTVSPMT